MPDSLKPENQIPDLLGLVQGGSQRTGIAKVQFRRPLLLKSSIIFAAALAVLLPRAIHAEARLVIEADTGKVLEAENATVPWYPASVSKLMTAYLTLRAVKERRITLDTLFTVSANATSQAPSKMGFPVGTQVTVDNALKMLMVKSANDIAVVLAEGVAGSVESFADEMNRASQRLGMTQSSWVNPNGLPAEEQVTSARDLGILARALIREFPEYDFYWHVPAIKLGKKVMRNYNKLLERYPGADGMKTGFICASGFNLVASATRGNRRLIAVVLGARSSPVRTAKAASLLEHGFNDTGLSWLRPSLGSVENLTPINAAPPNLREEMCGPHRKRPAAEDADDDEPVASAETDSQRTFMLSNLKGSVAKPSALIANEVPVGPPVVVSVVAPKKPAVQPGSNPDAPAQAGATAASPEAAPAKARPKPATAAHRPKKPAPQTAAPKPTAAKATATKPTATKPTTAKPTAAKQKPKVTAAPAAKPMAAKPAPSRVAAKPKVTPAAQ
jgi:D-alanyl-D-alanine carboxypeptidase